MADSNAIRAGKAFVEFGADSTNLDRALKMIEKRLKAIGSTFENWGRGMMKIGTAITAPLTALAVKAGETGERLEAMAAKTGISVEALSALDFAAGQTGTNLDAIAGGVKKMQKFLEGGADGSAKAAEELAKLGLTLDDLRGKSPDQQFEMLAAKIAALPSAAQRTATAMAIFGKSATDLLPLMRQGAGGIEALMARAKELGLVISGEEAANARAFHDKLEELWAVIRKVGFDIGGVVIPMLTSFANKVEKTVGEVTKWVKEHKGAIVLAMQFGSALLIAGAGMYVFGLAVNKVAAAISVVRTVISAAWTILSGLGGVITTVLSSPLLMVAAAVAAVGVVIFVMSGNAAKAVAWLGQKFAEIQGFAMKVFGGIADALQAGDITLAAKILWASIRVAWEAGVGWITDVWDGFKIFVIKTFFDILRFFGVSARDFFKIWGNVTHGVAVAWIETVAFLKKLWEGFKVWWQQNIINPIASTYGKQLAHEEAMIDTWKQYGVGSDLTESQKRTKQKVGGLTDAEAKGHALSATEAKDINAKYAGVNAEAGKFLTGHQISSIDKSKRNAIDAGIDQTVATDNTKLEADAQKEIADAEAEREKDRKAEDARFNKEMDGINRGAKDDPVRDAEAAKADAEKKHAETMAGLNKELDDLLAEAKKEKDKKETPTLPSGSPEADQLPGQSQYKNFGSFSAAAARVMFGGGNDAKKTADNTTALVKHAQETNKILGGMSRQSADGNLYFG